MDNHHGSQTSSTSEFIQAVDPKWAVISCGAGNSYGHPHEKTLSTLSHVEVLRTDELGTIIFHSDGQKLIYHSEKKVGKVSSTPIPSSAPPVAASSNENNTDYYIGNKNSKKFHYPYCAGVKSMKDKNKVMLYSREEAINQGYTPCGTCRP